MFGLRIGAMGRVGSGLTLNQAAANVRNAYSTSPQVWYDPSDLSTLYQDSAGTTPVTAVGQPVGLMLDKSRGLVLGSELRSTGTTTVVGSATAATYNTTTGDGSAVRVDASNQSGVLFVVPSATKTYRISVTAGSPNGVLIRSTALTGSTLITVAAGATVSGYVSGATSYAIVANVGSGTATFIVNSLAELPGLHASQPTALSRPVLSSRYNLLTYTEQFDNAYWLKAAAGDGVVPVVTPNDAAAPDGTLSADKIVFSRVSSTSGNSSAIQSSSIAVTAVPYSGFVWIKAATAGDVGKVIQLRHVAAAAALNHTLTANWQLVGREELALAGGRFMQIGLITNTGPAGEVSVHIWGASLVPTNEAHLPYQSVAAATDYDADFSKFPPHLVCDGTDDGMVTPSWDLTSTDKVTVVAGVRKLSDAAFGMLMELSADVNSNNGSFYFAAPAISGTPRSYGFTSKGTLQAPTFMSGNTIPAPSSNVVTGIGDIGGDRATLRVNGSQLAQLTVDQGTGTYGNYPLYLFRRGGTTLPFNGRFYGLSIIGAQLSASDINVLERFTASKVGISL